MSNVTVLIKTNIAFDINQPFVTQEQKFKYWEESKKEIAELKAEIVRLNGGYYEPEPAKSKIEKLQADNAGLREALEKIKNSNSEGIVVEGRKSFTCRYVAKETLLTSTKAE